MMHGRGKSDSAIVAAKPANNAERSAAEPVEPRTEAKGNAGQQSTRRAQSRVSVSQALERIRQVAKERKKERFTALFHHISIDLLDEAFFELKQDAAAGVDDLTWQDYQANLERNLEDLHERVQRGAYRALPSRRTYIPKPDGRQRPLAIAALEDKIVQRRRSRCSTRSTRKTSSGSRMDSDPGGARMMRWTRSLSGSTARK
jgi:RNA-directed DNA polymerase